MSVTYVDQEQQSCPSCGQMIVAHVGIETVLGPVTLSASGAPVVQSSGSIVGVQVSHECGVFTA